MEQSTSVFEIIGTLEAQRRSKHRPAPLALPSDPAEAMLATLAIINGDDVSAVDRAAAIEGLTERVTKLASADGKAVLSELAQHLPVLHALFLRMAAEAATTNNHDHRSKLMRMSLAAQQNYARTAALLMTLQSENGHVIIEPDSED